MLNLDLIKNGANIGEMVDTINRNSSAIMEFGGGPQGPINNKSLPGLPGLGGKEGLSGLAGEDGSITNMTTEDPNWGTIYGIGVDGYPDATAAIDDGFNIGDKWINNINGIYYSIDVSNEFVEFPLSYASGSEFWTANPNSGDRTDGTRYSAYAGNITLTSLQDGATDNSVDNTDVIYQAWYSSTPNYGYLRDDFKLGIDEKADVANTSNLPTLFNIEQHEYAPLIYLGDNNTNNGGTAPNFGLLIYTDNSGNDNQVLSISNKKGVIYTDVLSQGTKNEFFTVANQDADVNRVTMVNSDGATTYNDSSYWFSMSRYINLTPAGDVTGFDDMGGIKLTNISDTLDIEFYTNSDTTDNTVDAYDKTMVIKNNRSVSINSFVNAPGTLTVRNKSGLGSTDTDTAVNTLVLQTPGWGNNSQGGTELVMGYGTGESLWGPEWEGSSFIFSRYRTNTVSGTGGHSTPLTLQPSEFSDNGVGIGYAELNNNKLAVDGNVAIGTNIQAPTSGLLVNGISRFGLNSDDSALAIATIRTSGNILMGEVDPGTTGGSTDISKVSLNLNSYTDSSGNIQPHMHTSNEQYGGAVRVTASYAGNIGGNIGVSIQTVNSDNAGLSTYGNLLVSGKKETMGYLGVNGQTVPEWAVDIAVLNTKNQGLHIGLDQDSNGGVGFVRTVSSFATGNGKGNVGPDLLIKNYEFQDVEPAFGGGYHSGQKNIIIETTFNSYDEGGPTLSRLLGSVIIKNDIIATPVINSSFSADTQMQIWHERVSSLHGLLIHGDDGNHLHLRGGQGTDVFFTSGGTSLSSATFEIWGNGDVVSEGDMYAISFNVTSDERFKENISELYVDSLENILNLRPVSFNFKDDDSKKIQFGLIAQDVDKIIPEVVNKTNPDKLTVNYTAIIPVLIGAIQELKAEIELLKNK